MKLLISGHRRKKLDDNGYDKHWIEDVIKSILLKIKESNEPFISYSGMADGVDLIFCGACNWHEMPYIACVPFDEQEDYMGEADKWLRQQMLDAAKEIKKVKNSWMVEHSDMAIVVWDGNKGGTANVVQQLIENKKDFYWVNPVGKTVWKCFN